MNNTKKRILAVLIAVVAVLGSFLISARRGLQESIRKTEMLYYNGIYSKQVGYTLPSIDSQMHVKYNSLNNLLGVLEAHPQLASSTEELRSLRESIYNSSNRYEDYTIGLMGWTNRELESALGALRRELQDVELSQREQEILEVSFSDLEGAQRLIEKSGYNEVVREFNTTDMRRFPARLLLPLFGNYQGGAAYFE